MGGSEGGRSFAADPIIAAPGPLPPAWVPQLVSCVVDENVGLPDAATLTFRDPDHEFMTVTGITVATPLKVSVATVGSQAQELLFSGEVTALELDSDTTGSFTVIRALSKAHRLFRGRKVLAFRNMSAGDIVRKVATGAGLAAGRIETAPITYPQLTQANVSDWEFLQGIAQEHGTTLGVDRTGKLEMVKLKPAASAPAPTTSAAQNPLVLEYGRNLMALRAVLTTADQVDSVEVRGWNVATKTALIAREPARTSKTVVPGMKMPPNGKAKMIVTDTPYGTQAETAAAARSIAASVSAGIGEVEAVAEGNPQLRAGVPVALGNAGPAFSGRYTATAAHHVLEPGSGYRTTVLVSASPDRSLAGLAIGGNAAPRGPRMPGLAIGIVTDIKEAGKAERGWVRLKFPWLADDYVTDWVRTVQFGGQGGGGVFSPEVNDEVLVGFEQGSLDRPYVLGGLYNGVDQPSPHDVPLVDRTSGRVNRRSLVSRSGQRIELLDARRGPTGVRLATGDEKFEIRLDQQGKQIVISVRGAGGRTALSSITLTERGITLDAGRGELSLRGRDISINGTTGVQVDGGMQAVLRGRIVRIN
jgi:phage protein D/phage baseplate assembly protein gpV